MNKKYNLKLDLQFRCNNSTMKFNQFDNNTSDFFMRITNGGNLVDIEKAIVVLAIIKPSGKVASQFIEVENGLVYADLKPSMIDEIGTYTAQAMLILEDERVVTDSISYEVEEDKIFSLLNDSAETSEEFTLLTDMLSRLSTIETNEEQRVINEAERILSEENRKIEEAKRVEAELIRQHEEADRAKYDATRESNENIRKQNESIRLANETNRIDEEAKRVEEEDKRKLAEEERNANYNFMTEDEERRRLEANAHKEAENLRAQAENTRVNEEAKRRTTEQARVLAENTRVSNENTRKANEETRQNNETHRVEAETQRQNRYNSFIADAEVNANNFENYTNSAKVKEEERKSNELNRKSQEDRRVSNEVERISNENARKANEVAREKNETSRQNIFENKVDEVDKKIVEINTTKDNFVSNINTKVDTKISEIDNVKDNFVSSINTKVDTKISEIEVAKSDMTNTVSNKINEVETRFNALTSSQQQDAEVIDARDGETSLKARLDRDIEKAKEIYAPVEGSNISTDSSSGYLKDVEILGNTIQNASNLADIRSVGDTVEGQELYEIPVLSVGKNLFDGNKFTPREAINQYSYIDGILTMRCDGQAYRRVDYILPNTLVHGKRYILTANVKALEYSSGYTPSQNFGYGYYNGGSSDYYGSFDASSNTAKLEFVYNEQGENVIGFHNEVKEGLTKLQWSNIQLEEGTQATPCEPYVEDKLTILSPTPLEKVGDVADRIIEKDGVWGIEKNVDDFKLENLDKVSITTTDTTYRVYLGVGLNIKTPCNYGFDTSLCNMLPFVQGEYYTRDEEHYYTEDVGAIFLFIDKSKFDGTKEGLNKYLEGKGYVIKYQLATPTFTPLPHDQQIKLRTFANKTNISFLTEIEGTIKAQVPKSLGATVNTHTEQISNLNKELDRVKKLEESTVSTVTTESDFTTVEATSNGYFEDVKLEGKTLVNLWDINSIGKSGETVVKNNRITVTTTSNIYSNFFYEQKSKFKPSTEYTIIVDVYKNTLQSNDIVFITSNSGANFDNRDIFAANGGTQFTITGGTVGRFVRKRTTISDFSEVYYSLRSFVANNSQTEGGELELVITVLEGDHTQNPPSYFEGLKSVGDGVDEVSVESVNENLIPNIKFKKGGTDTPPYNDLNLDNARYRSLGDFIFLPKGEYCINSNQSVSSQSIAFKVKDMFGKDIIGITGTPFTFNNPINQYVYIFGRKGGGEWDLGEYPSDIGLTLTKGKDLNSYALHQSDKKRLLYYNEETQTWEKPVLREWDSIEKHANGKYYYHQRSGVKVLNGSENISCNDTYAGDKENTCIFRYFVSTIKKSGGMISDRFNNIGHIWGLDEEGIYPVETSVDIRISKTKLGITSDDDNNSKITKFKQWLQANNVTVVYQLAQEKVYECTNIDLITYANETNYIVECGAISPKTTLKVHNNISNVVSLLQKKVSLLENNITSYMITQNRLMLASRYNADTVSFKVDVATLRNSFEYDNDLYELILNNILVGKDNYNREYIENLIIFYWMDFVISDEMYSTLFEIIEEQHNPKIEEETPLI